MEKKLSSTRPATVKFSLPDFMDKLIELTHVEVNNEFIGRFRPDSVVETAESLLDGIIDHLVNRLTDEEFKRYYVCQFITNTDLYLLTDANKLKQGLADKGKESKIIITPPTKHYSFCPNFVCES